MMSKNIILKVFVMMVSLVFVCSAQAEIETSKTKMIQTEPQGAVRTHVFATYGNETRSEKDSNAQTQQQDYKHYSLGVGGFGDWRSFLFSVEKSEHQEKSGNDTLSVQQSFEDYLLFVDYRSPYGLSGAKYGSWWQHLYPFMGLGAGAYKQSVETTLVGQRKMDESEYRFLTSARLGLTWQLPILWVSVEGRILSGDELQQQLIFGTLLRVGFWL